jgi:hypothetical protein
MVLDTNFLKKLFAFSKNSLELTFRQKLMAGWEVVTSFYIAFFRIKIILTIDVFVKNGSRYKFSEKAVRIF